MGVHSDKYLSRVAIYPPDAIKDIDQHLSGEIPFDKAVMLSRKAKNSQLIHIGQQPIPGASIFNGDRTGLLVESLIEKASTQISVPLSASPQPLIDVPKLDQMVERRKPGRPKKIIA
jgi:hypothetical protein